MRAAIASVLFLLASSLFADPAMACSCARHPTAESILKGAAAVFTAVAQDSVKVAPARSVTTFKIVESFKGPAAGATVRVFHRSGSSASCGVKFRSGETYTLAAHQTEAEPRLSTSLCSTWMFTSRVGPRAGLIRRMREIRDRN